MRATQRSQFPLREESQVELLRRDAQRTWRANSFGHNSIVGQVTTV